MADLLLTHGYFMYEDPKELQILKPYPPLGILYLCSHLRQKGFDVDVYDSTFSSREDLFRHLRTERPGMLGIYANLMTRQECGGDPDGRARSQLEDYRWRPGTRRIHPRIPSSRGRLRRDGRRRTHDGGIALRSSREGSEARAVRFPGSSSSTNGATSSNRTRAQITTSTRNRGRRGTPSIFRDT